MFRYSWFGNLLRNLADLAWEIVIKNILIGVAILVYAIGDAGRWCFTSFTSLPRFDRVMFALMVANLGSLLAIVKISGNLDFQYRSTGNIAWLGASLTASLVLPAILIIKQSTKRSNARSEAKG